MAVNESSDDLFLFDRRYKDLKQNIKIHDRSIL